ncbi:hypothetical protein [Virgibacillus senegalensis]|uniref:hypothetical protein n=1 Tax=Virgibacillus senegalensis TaxID=1499679 RepID=UPI00069F64F9|nr:hypothetical protein [Virgibacillus senegalensis]
MAKVFFTLFVMVLLFLFGMLTGINQVSEEPVGEGSGNGQNIRLVSEKEKVPLVTVQEPEEDSILAASKDYEPVKETHLTQKLAASLGSFLSWFYNQMIAAIYQLVQVFF